MRRSRSRVEVVRSRNGIDKLTVLHCSNNVVAGCRDLVVKVSANLEMAARDVTMGSHVAVRDGPALAPVGELVEDDGFAVSVWPYCKPGTPPDDADHNAASALAALHVAMAEPPVALPALIERFTAVGELLADTAATSALGDRDRKMLQAAVQSVVPDAIGSAVLHEEPHDRNRLVCDGSTIYIDFEAACVGPIEWDLAYLPDDVALSVWPDHDVRLRSALQLGFSTCVAVACWRHVSARPRDVEMRWHADHHLARVRQRVA
jgi:Ser/Thr protein kinase RdoA (MazF antagonist)